MNDGCLSPTVIEAVPFVDVRDTTVATTASDDPPQCAFGQNSRSVWYELTVGVDGIVTADTFESGYDTVLSVSRGTCGALDNVACSDDIVSVNQQSQVSFPAKAGERYLFEVTRFGAGRAGGLLRFSVAQSELETIGCTTHASVGSEPLTGFAGRAPTISTGGRFVVFESDVPNLIGGDGNDALDVFVRDEVTGAVERVSVSQTGGEANDDTGRSGLAVSADGRYVAFTSFASNLVPADANGALDVFVRDRCIADGVPVQACTPTTERVSVGAGGEEAQGPSREPALSADGRFVAFDSTAPELTPDDGNGVSDVFVRDRVTGSVERVSVGSESPQFGGGEVPALSADGRFVAFHSVAGDLVTGDTNGAFDVFVRDRCVVAGVAVDDCQRTTERVSVGSTGEQGIGFSYAAALSGDARFVAFTSSAANLVFDDGNFTFDVFVRDRCISDGELIAGCVTGTERVSISTTGAEGNGTSGVTGPGVPQPGFSTDGRYVAFASDASNLVPRDSNGAQDVFLRDRCLTNGITVPGCVPSTLRASVGTGGIEGNGPSGGRLGLGVRSDGGVIVAFKSNASSFVLDDVNDSGADVFVRDLFGRCLPTLNLRVREGASVDLGVTGLAHAARLPSGSAVGVGLDCGSGPTCIFAPPVSAHFGPPSPFSVGNVPFCIVTDVLAPASTVAGSYDQQSGCIDLGLDLRARVFLAPCPLCLGDAEPGDDARGGTCSGDAATPGVACDVDGVHPVLGETSHDCLPAGESVGEASVSVVLTSGPLSATAGVDCASSLFPPGSCHCPGQVAPNACHDGLCSPTGECEAGPFEAFCSGDPLRSCDPGTGAEDCEDVFPGAGDCVISLQPCFGSSIPASGACGTPDASLVTYFCMPATRAPAINSAIGLPGPALVTLPVETSLSPP
jgi:hypothetical protein